MSVQTLPGVFTIPEAARYVRLSERKLKSEIAEGRLKARYIGRCRRILDSDLAEWLRQLESERAS